MTSGLPKSIHDRDLVATTTLPSGLPSVEESRQLLLNAVGENPDLTLIRTEGNIGDQLIWAGTRCLLQDRVYREIGIEEVSSANGELAVIMGSGAWGRVYNQFLPELLAIAEMRFDRVIVFPSTFEVAEDRVREALSRSSATFFAREEESYRQISGICRARLALDGAFYFDYSRYRQVEGTGELNAFRTDEERLGVTTPPRDNQDISITSTSLESWLETIAEFETVNTDRAHVMIAAALMGKRVRYAPSNYFKVGALAAALLDDYDVQRIPTPSNGHVERANIPAPARPPEPAPTTPTSTRVSVHITGRDDAAYVQRSIDSSLADGAQVVVVDRNSQPETRRILERLAAQDGATDFRFADRDAGVCETVRLAAAETAADYLMVLRYDMQLMPGSLERMIDVLDSNPTVQAVAPVIVNAEGVVQYAGGWPTLDAETIALDFTDEDKPADALRAADTSTTGWLPTCGSLFRKSALDAVPFAAFDDELLQSTDWCLRSAHLGLDAMKVCSAATVVSARRPDSETQPMFVSRRLAASQLGGHAEFMARHGRLFADRLAQLVPELKSLEGEFDVPAARLLLDLVAARGPEWTLMNWMNGGLDPIFAGVIAGSPAAVKSEREELAWLKLRNEALVGIENGSWWRLRNRLQPLRKLLRRASDGS